MALAATRRWRGLAPNSNRYLKPTCSAFAACASSRLGVVVAGQLDAVAVCWGRDVLPFDFAAGTNGFFLAAPAGLQQAVGRYWKKTAACKTCVARPTSATLVKVISPMYPLHRAALLTALVAPAAATVGKSTYAMSHPFAFNSDPQSCSAASV